MKPRVFVPIHAMLLLAACGGSGGPGNVPLVNRNVPGAAQQIVQIAAGERHTCVATRDGLAFCWGANETGQLGIGTVHASLRPVQMVIVEDNLVYSNVERITVGAAHTCAIIDGAPFCWGDNTAAQLGDGTFQLRPLMTRVTGVPPAASSSIGAGARSSCMYASHDFYCWGANDRLQLGTTEVTVSTKAVKVSRPAGLDANPEWDGGVSVGAAHACSILHNVGVWCWGDNSSGQLGADPAAIAQSAIPVNIPNLAVVRVSAGARHTCAVPPASPPLNAVYCWGANDGGQLGNGTTADSAAPVMVALPRAPLNVSAGGSHTCAVVDSGQIYCWGSNAHGQLGDGTRSSNGRLVEVRTDTDDTPAFVAVSAGKSHTCAIDQALGVWCWGANESGQLGIDSMTDAPSPQLVRF